MFPRTEYTIVIESDQLNIYSITELYVLSLNVYYIIRLY